MTIPDSVDEHGYAVIEHALPSAVCDHVLQEIGDDAAPMEKRGGVRNALQQWPCVREVATRSAVFDHVASVLGDGCFAVRAILFDKTPSANWKVGWHQDVAIPVQARHDVAGFGPWSVKAGVPHVRPPAGVLESMLTARLHLDDCGEANGPLRVAPGTHKGGILDATEAIEAGHKSAVRNACTRKGGVVLMRPLLVHSSSAATEPSHRRVLHVEYAARQLPTPLRWFERYAPHHGGRPATEQHSIGL